MLKRILIITLILTTTVFIAFAQPGSQIQKTTIEKNIEEIQYLGDSLKERVKLVVDGQITEARERKEMMEAGRPQTNIIGHERVLDNFIKKLPQPKTIDQRLAWWKKVKEKIDQLTEDKSLANHLQAHANRYLLNKEFDEDVGRYNNLLRELQTRGYLKGLSPMLKSDLIKTAQEAEIARLRAEQRRLARQQAISPPATPNIFQRFFNFFTRPPALPGGGGGPRRIGR